MKTLLVLNNFFLLKEHHYSYDNILFAPIFHSNLQKEFHLNRFKEIQKIAPKAVWCEVASYEEIDLVLSWDALYERRAFKEKIYPAQNRLFSSLEFELPKTFTPFFKEAISLLPAFYENAIAPWDSEVKEEIQYYFHEKKLASTYFETRNELTGRDGSTKLSAYLSCGALDIRYLYNQIRKFESHVGANKSTEHLIYEILWREFFYWHYQRHAHQYFSKNGIKGELDFTDFSCHTMDELKELTKEPFFHAALNELQQTGNMSNRARQMFASMWINDLGLDWRAGAQLFEEELLDYDVYSNYGNWLYLAGVGCDPRGKRYFNISKQLSTYDPSGSYLKKWL